MSPKRQCSTVIKFWIYLTILNVAHAKHLYVLNEFICPNNCKCTNIFEESVDCSNNDLVTLPNDIDVQTKILDLSFNFFTTIPRQVVQMQNLTHLIMAHNKITSLTRLTKPLNLNSLTVLDLSHNNIKQINDIQPFLNSLKSLKELDLSHNSLYRVSNEKPLNITSLEVLKLNNCSIYVINSEFLLYLNKLKTLILSNNLIHTLNLFSNSTEILDASSSNIEHINLMNFPNLVEAYLSGNRINSIKPKQFHNSELLTLDLSDNAIKEIHPYAFVNLKSLKTLNISVNVFNDLHPDTFLHNINLKTVIASRTYLQRLIPFNSSSLQYLDLSVNEIQHFEENGLTGMPSIQFLLLSRNLISTLPTKIQSNSLRILDLSTCQIIEVKSETFVHLLNLIELNLSGNRLTTLKKDYFPKDLMSLHLDNNPWRCECYAREFRNLYIYLTNPPGVGVKNNLICLSPESVSGVNWQNACYDVWYSSGTVIANNKLLAYILASIASIGALMSFYVYIRKIFQTRRNRVETERERLRQEAQERINRIRIQHQMSRDAQQNAPDPRELQRPPSYAEALRMPRLDGSFHSLTEITRIETSENNNQGSMPDLSKRNQEGRKIQGNKRRRRRARSSQGEPGRSNSESASAVLNGDAETSNEQEQSNN